MSDSQTFIAHLIERRSRLVRSMLALLLVFLCLTLFTACALHVRLRLRHAAAFA